MQKNNMAKRCVHCNNELFNKYVNACHLCFTRDNDFNQRFINESVLSVPEKKERYLSKTLPFPWKGDKIVEDDNYFNNYIKKDEFTEQKLDDGTIIIRRIKEYHTGLFKSILDRVYPLNEDIPMSFEEYIYIDNYEIEQKWEYLKQTKGFNKDYAYAGEGMYLLGSLKIQKKSEVGSFIYIWYGNYPKGSFLSSARTEKVDLDCYSNNDMSITDMPEKINKRFKFENGSCISGEKFDRNGNLLDSFHNRNGYLIDEYSSTLLPCIYICDNGKLEDYYCSERKTSFPTWKEEYNRVYTYVMNLEERKQQQKLDEINREEYSRAVEKLEKDFNPTQYNKNCPECFEKIKLPAKICHFCKRKFSKDEVESQIHSKLEDLKKEL